MATETQTALTAEQALDQTLRVIFGGFSHGWRETLETHEACGTPDDAMIANGPTLGDLRRWSAPLRSDA